MDTVEQQVKDHGLLTETRIISDNGPNVLQHLKKGSTARFFRKKRKNDYIYIALNRAARRFLHAISGQKNKDLEDVTINVRNNTFY